MLIAAAGEIKRGFHRLPLGLERLRRFPSIVLAMADQAVVSGANFLAVIALARCISIEEFGKFTLAFSVMLFFSSLIYAVVVLPISVFAPEREAERAAAYFARLELTHRILIPGMLLLAIPAILLLQHWELIIAAALATSLRMGVEYHRRLAYALRDSLRALLVDGVAYGTLCLAAVLLLFRPFDCGAAAALAVMAGAAGIGWAVGFCANRRMIAMDRPEALAPVAKQHWEFGKWNLGGAFAMWGASQLYPFLVAGILGLREVALLNGSIRILGVSNVLIQGIEAFTTPRLRKHLIDHDVARFKRALLKLFLVGMSAMLPLCLVMMLFPRAVLETVLGERFAHGEFVLQAIALAQLFTFLSRMSSIGLKALKQPKPGFWAQAVCAALTMLAGPMIVAHYGLKGACLALLANSSIIFLITALSFYNLLARRHVLRELA
jgi:O-antigen/teichoic acid export membrane protein